MIRVLAICFVFITCVGAASFGQIADQKAKPLKQYELRTSSRDYAPVRRGNTYETIQRSKKPGLRSHQLESKNKNAAKGKQKLNKSRKGSSAHHKNRRIR